MREALEEARRLYGQGFAPRSLVGGLMEVLREALYAAHGLPGRSLPLSPKELLFALSRLDEALERLAKRSDPLALEVALLQAFSPSPAQAPPGLQAPPPQEAPLPEFHPLAPLPPRPRQEASSQADLSGLWRAFLKDLKPTLRAFVREARPEVQGKTLLLRFPESKAFHHKRAEEQKAHLLPLAQSRFGVEEVAFLLEKKKPGA